jgi:hypothetical protein
MGQLQGPLITVIGYVYATGARSDATERMLLAIEAAAWSPRAGRKRSLRLRRPVR